MKKRFWGHGCLLWSVAAAMGGDGVQSEFARPAMVRTRRFDIEYHVNEDALPLTRVELWYSRDEGQTWHNYGLDEDNQSPIRFDASEEGLYGFYFVIANHLGASASIPQPGASPQHWAFVDYTPPILQVRPISLEGDGVGRLVRVRWSALDAHLEPRPIELDYRILPESEWRRLAGPLANTGMYDWHPPEDLEGRILVRVTVVDRGGHRIVAEAPPVEIVKGAPSAETAALASAATATTQPSAGESARAEKLLARAMAHQERGEYRLAASRLRDALAIDSQLTEALVQLGEALYFQGQHPESIQAYRLALEQEPAWLRARRGLARTLAASKLYDQAAEEFARILEADPHDAEAWLDQGDLAMRRGDEALARESWRQAESIEGRPEEIAERARARLNDVDRLAPWRLGSSRP